MAGYCERLTLFSVPPFLRTVRCLGGTREDVIDELVAREIIDLRIKAGKTDQH